MWMVKPLWAVLFHIAQDWLLFCQLKRAVSWFWMPNVIAAGLMYACITIIHACLLQICLASAQVLALYGLIWRVKHEYHSECAPLYAWGISSPTAPVLSEAEEHRAAEAEDQALHFLTFFPLAAPLIFVSGSFRLLDNFVVLGPKKDSSRPACKVMKPESVATEAVTSEP